MKVTLFASLLLKIFLWDIFVLCTVTGTHLPLFENGKKSRGGGALIYNGGYGCVAGTFKPLPFADQNFGKILDPLQTNERKFSKIFILKRRPK